MLRKICVFLASSSLSFLLFITVTLAAVTLTFTPARIKGWLNGSQIYSTIVDDLLEQSKTLNKGGGEKNPLDDPGIQAVAKQTFSPEFLRSNVEQVIDGTTPWLDGKVPKPTFSLDLSSVKAQFADNIGTYARTRYNQLPACQPGQVPESTDVLTVDCKVAGVNPGPEIQKAVDDLKNSDEFLSNTNVTADTLTINSSGLVGDQVKDSDRQPVYEKFKDVPKIYQWAKLSPLIFGGLSLISVLVIVFLSADRRRGIRRVASILFFTSIILFLEVYLVNFGIDKANQKLQNASDVNGGLQSTGLAVLKEVQADFNHVLLMFAIGFLAVAVLKTVYLLVTKPKAMPEAKPVATPPDEEQIEEETKPETKPKSAPKNKSDDSQTS